MFWDSVPAGYDLDALIADPSLLDRGPTKFNPDKAESRFLLYLPVTLWAMIRSASRIRRARRSVHQRFECNVLPPYLDYVRQRKEQDLGNLSVQQLLAELHDRCSRVLDRFGPESLLPGFVGSLAFQSLQTLLIQLLGDREGTTLAATLTSALDGDTTIEQSVMLEDVASGRVAPEQFLERFGHRADDEMELSRPRWREDPTYVLQIVDRN
jgi:hypothetical protein